MPITALPDPPSRADPTNFNARADALFEALPAFVTQANALESSLQASVLTATSTTSLTVSAASKALTTQPGKAWAVGAWLYLINSAAPTTYMVGQVSAYDSATGALTVNVTTVSGTGTVATWAIAPATPPGAVSGLAGGTPGVVPYQSATGVTGFTSAGTAGQVLLSGGTGVPTWSSAPAVTTQAIGTNSTAAASTAFVRAIGPARSAIVNQTTTATLTASAIGSLQVWAGTSAATITLPAASAVPAGLAIEFVGSGASMAAATISRAGADTIADGDASLTSLQITQPGAVFGLVSDGTSTWRYVGPRRRYESAWTTNMPTSGAATAFTHGLGVTPRVVSLIAECVTADAGYASGERTANVTQSNGAWEPTIGLITTPTQVVVSAIAGPYRVPSRTGGSAVAITTASWRYRVAAEV